MDITQVILININSLQNQSKDLLICNIPNNINFFKNKLPNNTQKIIHMAFLQQHTNQLSNSISYINKQVNYLVLCLIIVLYPPFFFILLIIILKLYLLMDKSITNTNMKQILIDFYYDYKRDYCAICLMNECNLILECNHYFHINCFKKWIDQSLICPVCRSVNRGQLKIVNCIKCKNKCWIISTSSLREFKKQNNCCNK